MLKSKTVIKEFANGESTTTEENSMCYNAVSGSSLRSISLLDFVNLVDEKTVKFLNLNYPEYAEGDISAYEDNSSFIIKYNTSFEDEEILIRITERTIYFDKTTRLYKNKENFSIEYSVINSWRFNRYDGEFVYELESCHFNGDGLSMSADFTGGGLLSVNKIYKNEENEDYTLSRRMWAQPNRFIDEERNTVYDKGNPIKETVEFKPNGNAADNILLKQTTIYTYDEEKGE